MTKVEKAITFRNYNIGKSYFFHYERYGYNFKSRLTEMKMRKSWKVYWLLASYINHVH